MALRKIRMTKMHAFCAGAFTRKGGRELEIGWFRMRLLLLTLALLLLLLFSACSSARKFYPAVPTQEGESTAYRIAPGDYLAVRLYYHPELNTEVWVRPDGFISLELVGEIAAAGCTPNALDSLLQACYRRRLVEPEVAVSVKSSSTQKVFVGGEVQSPGLVPFDAGLTLLGAVFQAGGFKSSAQISHITVLRRDARTGRALTINLDLRHALGGETPESDAELRPFDVVFVPKSGVAKANQFVDEFVEGLLPASTLSGFAWVYALMGK